MDKNVQRENYIDAARGFVIILMLVGHSQNVPHIVWQAIYGFHMPFFFILSGYLYDPEKWQKRGFGSLLKKKAKAYLLPYLILSVANLLINIPVDCFHNDIVGWALLKKNLFYLLGILYSPCHNCYVPNCLPLWFLTCAFLANIYLYLLFKIKNRVLQVLVSSLGIAVCLAFGKYKINNLPWHLVLALFGMAFMYFGVMLRKTDFLKKISENKVSYITCLIFLVLFGEYSNYSNDGEVDMNLSHFGNGILMIVSACFLTVAVLLFFSKFMKKSRVLVLFGKNTILFMALNYAVNTYFTLVWNRIPLLRNIPYTWWMMSLADVIIIGIIVLIWQKIKDKHPAVAIF